MKIIFIALMLTACGSYEIVPKEQAPALAPKAESTSTTDTPPAETQPEAPTETMYAGPKADPDPAPAKQAAPVKIVLAAPRDPATDGCNRGIGTNLADCIHYPSTDLNWINPDNGLAWRILLGVNYFRDATCPDSWQLVKTTLPPEFVKYALAHGYAHGGTYWTSVEGTIGHFVRTLESGGEVSADVADMTGHLIICTEETK